MGNHSGSFSTNIYDYFFVYYYPGIAEVNGIILT